MAATTLHGISSRNSNTTNYYYQSLRRVGGREPECHSQTLDGGETPSQSGSGGHDGVTFYSPKLSKILLLQKIFIFIFLFAE